MAKYLIRGSYTLEGIKGLILDGGSVRQKHFEENIFNLGGQVESFYFAFGSDDIYAVLDLPDNVSSAAISLAINAGGGFKGETVVLLTAEEMDLATQQAKTGGRKTPGGPAPKDGFRT